MSTGSRNFLLVCTVLGGLTMPFSVSAQGSYKEYKEQIETTRWAMQSQRKTVIARNMQFTEKEDKAFWPLYEEYRTAMGKTGDRLVELITNYADAYKAQNLSDAEALRMVKEYLKKRTNLR